MKFISSYNYKNKTIFTSESYWDENVWCSDKYSYDSNSDKWFKLDNKEFVDGYILKARIEFMNKRGLAKL